MLIEAVTGSVRPLACWNAPLLDCKILILMKVFGYIKHYQNWSMVAIKQNQTVLIRDFEHVLGCLCVLYSESFSCLWMCSQDLLLNLSVELAQVLERKH